MAISTENLPIILKACKAIPSRNKLLILGNANVFVSKSDLISAAQKLNYPLSAIEEPLNPVSFGRALGFQNVDTLDINGKASIQFNLHDELPGSLRSAFDCVIDAGVLYWCFDPAAAIRNIFRMTKTDGAMIHSVALTGYFGRGYYNIHPKMFEDFYSSNGAEMLGFSTHTRFITQRVISKIYRMLFGALNPVNEMPGRLNHFVSESSAHRLRFTNQLSQSEPNTLPNNTTGTLAFQKRKEQEPAYPLQMS